MKQLLLALTISLFFSSVCAQNLSGPIPDNVKTYLDSTYPGWKLAEHWSSIGGNPKDYGRTFDLNYFKGDFDGNGKTDFALHIQHPDSNYKTGYARPMLVLLTTSKGFERHIINRYAEQYVYFWLHRKGEVVGAAHADTSIKLENDALSVLVEEKASTLYYFRNGEFVPFSTGD
ncbi:MAG: hypothetical protein ABJK11_03130 [Balneola sp.]